jgi:hypothetical protein
MRRLMANIPSCAAGLSSVQDDLFRSSFVDVYSSPSLKGIPWHAVLGCGPHAISHPVRSQAVPIATPMRAANLK